jgi:catechol 2,3-dioxygenase-like lactoylglutathione lyase family enzyme
MHDATMSAPPDRWPSLPYAAWADTAATLQLWTQVVGKIRLARTPWLNHSWHVALYVTARGLTTSPIPDGARSFQIDFDFIDHVLWIRASDGHFRQLVLQPMPVAEFYADVMIALKELGIVVAIRTMPCEIPNCIPFEQDTVHASYDADAGNRFWRVLLGAQRVMAHFRTGFLGKVSPVHFFWGSFDLAVTRFSGRSAPRHPGGVPHLPNAVAHEAYSHEVSSAGFWPGSTGPVDYPAFYSYAYPAPEGFTAVRVKPDAAFFSKELGEFILPYDAMRNARDPDGALMEFLQSTYAAAADLAKWDRAALECGLGVAGKPRAI